MEPKTQAITYLKGVGEKRSKLYAKLGIETVWDLMTYYPRSYIDYNNYVSVNDAVVGEMCVIKAVIVQKLHPYIGRISVYKAIISDGENEMLAVFFNSEFQFQKLIANHEYLFYGKITGDILRKEITSPMFIDVNSQNKLTPKYHLTQGLSQNMIMGNLHSALDEYDCNDLLNESIINEHKLVSFETALEKIHFPDNIEEYNQAKRRLAFQELLVLQLGLNMLKSRNRKLTGSKMQSQSLTDFYTALPFSPTNAQIRAIKECVSDMQEIEPMNRLLQGDVGSGKTLVAAAICYFAFKNGFQSTLMAPTEILTKQHFDTLNSLLAPLGVKVILLIGSNTAKEKKVIKEQIASGEANVIIGTQALIQKTTIFHKLGLVVTDEQHRFGVAQRSTLIAKGKNPHTLVMSATPIPRTLALIIYGDLDISILDEMPKGRLPIKTYGVNSSYRERLYKFILKYINDGKQAYIVCPLIQDGVSEKASATAYYEQLKQGYFKDIPIGLLHGKMKQADKDAVMTAFKNNETKVLISTTVIEVGVDVPNAVVMLIENAEQFGLSQLHQLRGRVGRGNVQSHCALITDNESEYTKARIDTMVRTSDGFEIANEDLKLRGPGDFFGSKQHGLPQLKISDISADLPLLEETKAVAADILSKDETLSCKENAGLKQLVKELFQDSESYGYN